MPDVVISLFMAAGAGAWTYSKIMRSSGNNTQNAILATVIAAILVFILMQTVLGYIPD